MVNGWIGLGVLHCHRHSHSDDDLFKTQQMFFAFQTEFRKLLAKFPQLEAELSATVLDLMKLKISD